MSEFRIIWDCLATLVHLLHRVETRLNTSFFVNWSLVSINTCFSYSSIVDSFKELYIKKSMTYFIENKKFRSLFSKLQSNFIVTIIQVDNWEHLCYLKQWFGETSVLANRVWKKKHITFTPKFSFHSQVICKKPNMISVRARVFFRNTEFILKRVSCTRSLLIEVVEL